MKPEKSGFVQKLLKAAGLTALLGLVTYLARNPEAWKEAKKFFKETFVPWLEYAAKKLPDIISKPGYWFYKKH